MNILAHAKLPSAGLGNKIFTWAQAKVFSYKNQCGFYVSGWVKLHLKTILRGDKSWRFYNYFKPNHLSNWAKFHYLRFFGKKQVVPSAAFPNTTPQQNQTIYEFNEIPDWFDSFKGLKEFRLKLKEDFFSSLKPFIIQKINAYDAPCIGVHIRMGDFKKLSEGTDFSKVGGTRTPLQYFVDIIRKIRAFAGKELPVTIFSDGKKEELQEVLDLPNAQLMPDDLDIVHLLVMSKSKVIIGSAGSTFSYWAMFFGEQAISIKHFQHNHSTIRGEDVNQKVYEGALEGNAENWNPLLKQNLMDLAKSY